MADETHVVGVTIVKKTDKLEEYVPDNISA